MCEILNGSRLQDVERFAGRGHAPAWSMRTMCLRHVDSGKRASDGAAQFSGSENGDGLHRYGIVYVGFHNNR